MSFFNKFNSMEKTILVFLILGLIFSHIVGVRYNITTGFISQGYWIKPFPFPLAEIASIDSEETMLTSTIVGYIFYIIGGLLLLKITKHKMKEFIMTIAFLASTLYAFYFEGTSIVQELSLTYQGQYLRIGPFLFLLGILLLIKLVTPVFMEKK